MGIIFQNFSSKVFIQPMDFQGVNSRFNGGMLLFRVHKLRCVFAFLIGFG